MRCFSIFIPCGKRSVIVCLAFVKDNSILSGDGEPEVATTIDHEAVATSNVQTRERGTVGVVAGGVDGLARTIDLGREGHVAQIGSADDHAGDRCRSSNSATCNALADTVDRGGVVVGRLARLNM